jgi:hypothetical protein
LLFLIVGLTRMCSPDIFRRALTDKALRPRVLTKNQYRNLCFSLQLHRNASTGLRLFRRWENTHRSITFNHCVNVESIVDCDVLADNFPNNTTILQSSTDAEAISKIMRRHKTFWNTSYPASIDLLPAKILAANTFVLFFFRLFGGTLSVVARSFKVTRIDDNKGSDTPDYVLFLSS